MSEDYILITLEQRFLAAPILGLLVDNGIDARVSSDDCGGVDPALAFALGVRVLVPLEDAERATELLKEYQEAEPELPDELKPADE